MSDKKEELKKVEKEELKKEELSDVEKATAIAVQTFLSFQKAGQPKPRAIPTTPTGGQCSDCGQPQFVGEGGIFYSCQGKHSRMVVFPAKYQQFFQGMFLNGVCYRSNDSGQVITVPASNDFQQGLERWDRQEEEYRNGRTMTPSKYNPITRG